MFMHLFLPSYRISVPVKSVEVICYMLLANLVLKRKATFNFFSTNLKLSLSLCDTLIQRYRKEWKCICTKTTTVISENQYKYQFFHLDLFMHYLETPFVLCLSPIDSTQKLFQWMIMVSDSYGSVSMPLDKHGWPLVLNSCIIYAHYWLLCLMCQWRI